VVAECLDAEFDAAIVAVGAGDGEGVCAFVGGEGDQGELSGMVAGPACRQATADGNDIACRTGDGENFSAHAPGFADVAEQ